MSAYVYRVGLVSKPHGLEGHVAVRLFRPRRDKSHKMKSVRGPVSVALATEAGDEDTFVLASLRFVDPTRAVLRLDGVDRDRAEALVGRFLDLDPTQLPGALVDDVDRAFGATAVHDETGDVLGVVADVRDNGAQAMLVIERPDGGEALVPYVDAFVAGLDAQGRLRLTPLPGLLDLE
ncbi:MAG: hypothetical protein RIT81_29325 [Deltaproteobacteria bacterium]